MCREFGRHDNISQLWLVSNSLVLKTIWASVVGGNICSVCSAVLPLFEALYGLAVYSTIH